MKKRYLFIIVFTLLITNSNAQFQDDMESYTDGEPISGGHWTDWGCGGGPGCALMSSSEEAHGGSLSGLIPGDGTTDAVLDLGNRIFGNWCLSFWMYVPSNKEAYWNLQPCLPVCAQDWGIHLFFNQNNNNPGVGHIDDTALGDIDFIFPHDQWFRILMYWDISAGISNAEWFLSIDGINTVPEGTVYTNQLGEIPTSLGSIEFFSISGLNSYYLDHFEFSEVDSDGYPCFFIFDLEDNEETGFEIYPNPVSEALYLQAEESITSISIRTILGQEVYSSNMQSLSYRLDVSNFSTGTYIIQATVGDSTITKKFIKD